MLFFFFSSRRRHTISLCDWSSDVCSSDLSVVRAIGRAAEAPREARLLDGVGAGEEAADRNARPSEGRVVRRAFERHLFDRLPVTREVGAEEILDSLRA